MSTVTTLERTIEIFKNDPSVPNLHATALKKYKIFCSNRTVNLYTTFFKLIGEEDLSWCSEATYKSSFRANVPFPGKANERNVSGGVTSSQRLQGIVRYEYKGNIVEECRKDGKIHGLRVVCTQMGHIWLRLYKDNQRLAQVVLNADLSEQSSIDEGGLKIVKENLHIIRSCFATE
jgi:hypothetical protein